MNREDIAVKLMEKHPKDFASKAAAMRAVSGVFDIIEESVAGGEAVVLLGFGSLSRSKFLQSAFPRSAWARPSRKRSCNAAEPAALLLRA